MSTGSSREPETALAGCSVEPNEASEHKTLLEGVPPGRVQLMEVFGDLHDHRQYTEEAEYISQAVPERRREFETVRVCARSALERLGEPPVPLIPGEQRAPIWPAGIVGSMTHCEGYRAAAVARSSDIASIGIDAELNASLPAEVMTLITLPEERLMLSRLKVVSPVIAWDRLLFSAKESVYKAWFPLTSRWLDFTQCRIGFDGASRSFAAHLLVPGPVVGGIQIQTLYGRWMTSGLLGAGHLATIAVIGDTQIGPRK